MTLAISSGDAAEALCRLSFASVEIFVLTSVGAVLTIGKGMTTIGVFNDSKTCFSAICSLPSNSFHLRPLITFPVLL